MGLRTADTMQGLTPTRRTVLYGLSSSLLLGLREARAEAEAVGLRFAAIKVDARPLVAIGGGGSADLVQRILPGKLESVFADRLAAGDRRAPTLVARIDRLYLTSFADNEAPGFGNMAMDYMDGAGIIVATGQPQATTPLHVTLSPGYSGAYYLPDIDARRIDSLCYQFAYWLRREMSL